MAPAIYLKRLTGRPPDFESNEHSFKVPITSVGILHICNLWIPLKKIVKYLVGRNFIFVDFFPC